MNSFSINLKHIQHINSLNYTIDLSQNSLHCIVGKNGVGKTTLVKAIQNFKETNALNKLSRLNIIRSDSEIIYAVNGDAYKFTSILDGDNYVLNTYGQLPQDSQKEIFTELPIPKGKRFDTYARLGGDIGEEIKTKFASSTYDEKPIELINILNAIYDSNEFNNLEQVTIKKELYYLKPIDNENYIREDDFSSGEYMIIQIYKLIQNKCKLIVIDELDISLDSRAQVNLIKKLQELAQTYAINIVFTTHSLAIMKKIDALEENLYLMENNNGVTTIDKHSYNFIKAELFQFTGYDKIILTEDKMLKSYLEYILKDEFISKLKYEIIHIAGASQVVDLMKRNSNSNFFNTKKVISFLDGDKSSEYIDENDIEFLPFESIEKELFRLYENNEIDDKIENKETLSHKLNELKPDGKTLSLKSKAKIVIDNIRFNNLRCIEFVNSFPDNQVKSNQIKTKIMEFLNQ
jgi:ABC-type cobalamin/Fe3+-siderophores transport system ATPase subunit